MTANRNLVLFPEGIFFETNDAAAGKTAFADAEALQLAPVKHRH